jgi:ribosome-dependent ATPase
LFGKVVDARDLETRKLVGYMSQSFSLYGELTVAANLDLHARLFHLPDARRGRRIAELMARFGLAPYADKAAADLPLGIRQRLSLAVAVVHEPKLLILDEPTSGVDPVARDEFWALLVELSRQQGVTIFISTHFMNEAERCDRISLMHAGKVLASDTPAGLCKTRARRHWKPPSSAIWRRRRALPDKLPRSTGKCAKNRKTRSRADVHCYAPRRRLSARRLQPAPPARLCLSRGARTAARQHPTGLRAARLGGHDVRARPWPVLRCRRAALRRTRSRSDAGKSRLHRQRGRFAVFRRAPALADDADLDRRMQSGEVSLAIDIPEGYGRDLRRGRKPEVGVWVDGAMPYRGETIRGYMDGLHRDYVRQMLREATGSYPAKVLEIQSRYRYNQDFKSIYAMVPAVIPLLLLLIPAILMALGVVREKELGSITNLYVTPVTRLEFLIGKQLPYIAVCMASYLLMMGEAVFVFGVPVKGSFAAMTLGALLYVTATTGLGLLMSTFTKTQIAALFGTAIVTMLPTIQFSGLTTPVEALEGRATGSARAIRRPISS